MDFPGSSYDHLHIGVESGHNIRELINDDGTIKCGGSLNLNKVNIGTAQPSNDETDTEDNSSEKETGFGSIFNLKF